GGSEDEMIAAVCHDLVEDQGGRAMLEELRRRYGDNVARIVAACSDAFVAPKPPWAERKRAHLAKLADPARADRSVLLVTAADKLDNATCLVDDLRRHGPSTMERFAGRTDGTLWYFESMA